MTRRHFEQIAATVRAIPDPTDRARMAQHWAGCLMLSNPRFDRARFLAACGVAA